MSEWETGRNAHGPDRGAEDVDGYDETAEDVARAVEVGHDLGDSGRGDGGGEGSKKGVSAVSFWDFARCARGGLGRRVSRTWRSP